MATETKRQSVVSTDIDNGILTITVAGFDPLRIDPSAFPDNIRDYAALHGFKQKTIDAAAIERDPDTGRSASAHDKYKAIVAVVDSLMQGTWNRTGGGDGAGNDGLLVRALVEFLGQPIEQVRETVGTWDKRTQAAMRADPNLAPIIARMRTARDAKKAGGVDTASLLASLKQ